MLISLDWISEFVDLPNLSPKELGEKFTLATAEVEDVETVGEFWKHLKVAQIKKITPHPEADKLNLVEFSVGSETKQVVCGANNVKVGLKTVFAPIGVSLPCGLTLEPRKIRGILSEGMLCSDEEIGLADKSDGIKELPDDAPVGQTIKDYFKKSEDILLDIDNKSLTHRPDLWGHYGMAREFAAIFENKLSDKFGSKFMEKMEGIANSEQSSPIKPKVDAECGCLGYFALSVDNVSVGPSPEWIQNRLINVGLRPINNIVDISNYVMLELGFPLHIFDRNKIKGNEVLISKLGKEAKFTTLDEVERELNSNDMVISDENGPLVIAGIMGGLSSGVSEDTTSILIEVANWQAAAVRKTSTRLGLRTDSSQRYEKSLDSQLMKRTLFRTLELVMEICPKAKVIGKVEYDGPNLFDFTPLKLDTTYDNFRKILGEKATNELIERVLSDLDFNVEKVDASSIRVAVPSYRSTKDIDCVADLIEEVGRVLGYDNIDPISPLVGVTPVNLSASKKLHRQIEDFLSLHGNFTQTMTYPLVGDKMLSRVKWPISGPKILNPISADQDIMRPSLIPSLLDICAKNAKHQDHFQLFEIGRSYLLQKKDFAVEQNHLGLCLYNKDGGNSNFLNAVNAVERLSSYINLPIDLSGHHPKFKNELIDENFWGLHPHEYFNIRIMGKMKGVIFSVHPLLMKSLKIKGQLTIAVIDLSSFENRELKNKMKYKPLPKFPISHFDCTVEAESDTAAENIITSLKKIKLREYINSSIKDIYNTDGKKFITISSQMGLDDKTLTGDQIKAVEVEIVKTLEKNGWPLKA